MFKTSAKNCPLLRYVGNQYGLYWLRFYRFIQRLNCIYHLQHIFHKRGEKVAFTLAEVLITLGIIGIIAALLIPQIVENHQKKVIALKLKKCYTILSQGLALSFVENGTPDSWEFSEGKDMVGNYIAPYIKHKKYSSKTASYDPSNSSSICGYNRYNWFTGIGISNPMSSNIGWIITEDNFCIGFQDLKNRPERGIFIDINNNNMKPNKAGIDLFFYYLDNKYQLRASGYDSSYNGITANCTPKTGQGSACAAKIMQDNWEVKYRLK